MTLLDDVQFVAIVDRRVVGNAEQPFGGQTRQGVDHAFDLVRRDVLKHVQTDQTRIGMALISPGNDVGVGVRQTLQIHVAGRLAELHSEGVNAIVQHVAQHTAAAAAGVQHRTVDFLCEVEHIGQLGLIGGLEDVEALVVREHIVIDRLHIGDGTHSGLATTRRDGPADLFGQLSQSGHAVFSPSNIPNAFP